MKKVLYAIPAFALLAGIANAQRARTAYTSDRVTRSVEDTADSLYRAGRAAINDRDYRRASSLFKQVADKYPKSSLAGDALYWRAWALYQLGNSNRTKADLDEALAALDRYNSNYGKDSAMASDATDLRGQIRAAQARLGDAQAAGDIAKAAGNLRQARSCNTADRALNSSEPKM